VSVCTMSLNPNASKWGYVHLFLELCLRRKMLEN
jgi:hypothetical protein